MTDQDNGPSPRVWSAAEINEQLDEVAEALIRGSHEFVRGFLFGAPSRRRRKPQRRQEQHNDQ